MKLSITPLIKTARNNPGSDVFTGAWFAGRLQAAIEKALKNHQKEKDLVEEIRIRINQPLILRTGKTEYFISPAGEDCHEQESIRITKEDIDTTLEKMTFSSLYAVEEELRQGFLTLPGGHRVGLAGEVLLEKGSVRSLKHISALNIRIAHELEGETKLLQYLLDQEKDICNTLIISPPRAGKTTVLRMLIKTLSNGLPAIQLAGQPVGVVDERGEIAGIWQGIPAFDLGIRTDILDRTPKALGIAMLIRSMSPSVVAVDELGAPEDVRSLEDAVRCGVKIIATAHAGSIEEIRERKQINGLLEQKVFRRIVLLSRRKGPGTLEKVFDPLDNRAIYSAGGDQKCW
ncbi:stage III sporulation protein AA [Syntrophobotulus glycolicus DSM 8271]|uniref:Stage III sporulation protein AA n=1 Tax=Syntrophobotulus glycolicus (strain DSM 8271 / FlGlyR) TaxID=645991 RepID=F0T0S4_SYNGF|nr:stage III sporulation protein AA [Syntrophobotulus glycolicus]ADY56213.1 stage III sporulation protein AA [Syntrophobotulus glycolicus DSM 8271]